MDIEFDFSKIWDQVKRVSKDKPLAFDWTAAQQMDSIDIELNQGREVKLEDLDIVNGLLSVDGRQVLLYIPDQHAAIEEVAENPERGKRFHVADCNTLNNMRAQGKFERYMVTNNTTGVFHIHGPSHTGLDGLQSRLLVCRNCLSKLNYGNYRHADKNSIWHSFSLDDFFEKYSTCFRHLPKRPNRRNEYAKDWHDISARVRQRQAFTCECCAVNLSQHRHLLHVHHINGNKWDNSTQNLQALCFDCHRKQPMHEHMHLPAADMRTINQARRAQGIAANNWDEAIALADLAVAPALLHARHQGYAHPVIGHSISAPGGTSCEVEAAWPDAAIGISARKLPDISGWHLFTAAEFLDAY